MAYIVFRYLHFIAILALAISLVIENLATSRRINGEDARNLARVDAVYGASALAVLVIGLILWLGVGKPAEFYSSNPLFIAKLVLFGLIALISLYPTLFFFRHRHATTEFIEIPAVLILALRAELALLVLVPILAMLMARGVGL